MHFNQNGLTTVIMVISLYPGERLGLGYSLVIQKKKMFYGQTDLSSRVGWSGLVFFLWRPKLI